MMDSEDDDRTEYSFTTGQPGDNANETILHRAVRTRDVDQVRKVVESGGLLYIYTLDRKSRSPIHVAIEEKLDLIVELFLSVAKDKILDDESLIHYAIAKGTIKTVKLLLESFSAEVKNQKNMISVGEIKKFEILDYLQNLCNSVNTSSDSCSDEALFYIAIITGNIELVKKFLESRFPIDNSLESSPDGWNILNDHIGFSPLHLAVKYLRLGVVELLLNEGADISKKNKAKSTALHIAFEAKRRGVWESWQDLETNDKIIDTILDFNLGNSVKLTNRDGVSHFHIACTRDRPELIEKFLQEENISVSDLTSCDAQGFSPLHFAAKYRCLKVAQLLLRYKVNVNQRDDENRTPLHIASKETSLMFVQLLIQHGADWTLKDYHGNTPIHLAFNDRNYAILDLLLTDEAIKNSNPTDAVGISHFHIACTRNNISLVRDFIDAGVSVNLRVPIGDHNIRYTKYNKDLDWRGCTPLHFAIAFNRKKIVQLLLQHEADVHRTDAKGFYPIHLACQQTYDRFGDLIKGSLQNWKNFCFAQSLEWMSVQLQNRPYSDITSVEEETKTTTSDPYPRKFPNIVSQINMFKTKRKNVIAWKHNRKEQIDIIKLLFKSGADLNAVDSFGNAPLYYICDFNIHKILDILDQKLHLDKKLGTLIVRSLLVEMYHRRTCLLKEIFGLGIHINVDKSYNNGPILNYFCQKHEFFDILLVLMVMYFLEKNADPDATDNAMRTPLHVITECCPSTWNLAIINRLLEANADADARESDGMTPLHNLLLHVYLKPVQQEEMIQTLLSYHANVDSRNGTGQTPLFLACLKKDSRLVNLLLRNGADVNIEDRDGQTALCYFYKKHILKYNGTKRMVDKNTYRIANRLIKHAAVLSIAGLHISEKVNSSSVKLYHYSSGIAIVENFQNSLKSQVEKLKNTKLNNEISLHDVILMSEHSVSKKAIIEQLEKIVLFSTESYIDIVPDYFYLINRKYHLAVERKHLLPMAKQTLDCLLSSHFPEICCDFIFMWLTNAEIADFIRSFVHLTKITRDNSKPKVYQRIRKTISKYVQLNDRNEFVIDLIMRRM